MCLISSLLRSIQMTIPFSSNRSHRPVNVEQQRSLGALRRSCLFVKEVVDNKSVTLSRTPVNFCIK